MRETAPGVFAHSAVPRSADPADFTAAVSAYLASLPGAQWLQPAWAIANPGTGDLVRMTNYHWQFLIEQMPDQLGLQTLVVGTPALRRVLSLRWPSCAKPGNSMARCRLSGCCRARASRWSTRRCASPQRR